MAGELCLAGAGLAAGYLNQPERTAEKFDHDKKFLPGGPGGAVFSKSAPPGRRRLYKTGDLAAWLPDGQIEFLGRLDHQVKIRGYRIELEEIETRLKQHRRLRDALVITSDHGPGEKSLYAYLVPAPSPSAAALEIPGIKQWLSQWLPDYMIPSHFQEIERIPLTLHGKIDRKALPAPGPGGGTGTIAPPRDGVERKLREIWAEILGIEEEHIGIDADFFRLGGHSLKAALLSHRIGSEFNRVIPLVQLFQNPFIQSLAEMIRDGAPAAEPLSTTGPGPVLLKPGTHRSGGSASLFLVHDGTGEVEGYLELCQCLTHDPELWGLRANRPGDLAPREQTIEAMARDYIEQIRRVQPHGPYHLAGWSLGGVIAFEITRQLEQEQENIGFLGLIDSPPPLHPAPGGKGSRQKEKEFDLEAERQFIERYLPGRVLKEKLLLVKEPGQLWSAVVKDLEGDPHQVENIKKTMSEYGLHALPHFHRLNLRESVFYLNVGRAFERARLNYLPAGKIHGRANYFAAAQSSITGKEQWNNYCRRPMTFYEIPGDHYSMLKMPNVTSLTALFAKILPRK